MSIRLLDWWFELLSVLNWTFNWYWLAREQTIFYLCSLPFSLLFNNLQDAIKAKISTICSRELTFNEWIGIDYDFIAVRLAAAVACAGDCWRIQFQTRWKRSFRFQCRAEQSRSVTVSQPDRDDDGRGRCPQQQQQQQQHNKSGGAQIQFLSISKKEKKKRSKIVGTSSGISRKNAVLPVGRIAWWTTQRPAICSHLAQLVVVLVVVKVSRSREFRSRAVSRENK